MRRCGAVTKNGRTCLNACRTGSEFCHVHASQASGGELIATLLGAVVGTAVAPGIGTIAGGVAGNKLRQTMLDRKSRKTKVFISFDFDHDRRLKDLILGQARHPDAPFKIINRSLKEAAPEPKWEAKANASIRRSDLVLVLLGERTYRAQGVLKEVKMARAAGVPIAQLIGYRHGRYTAVANAGRVYAWTRENLYKLFR